MYMGSSRHKISGNSMAEDMITYVAVGKDVQDCKSILSWALENNGGSRICIIHVHKPAKLFPLVRSLMTERKVRERLEIGTQNMHAIMEEYLQFCEQKGVHAQTLIIEMDSIRKGILKLIYRHGIRKLVVGSTSANHYRRKVELGSTKAKHLCKTAPVSCQVQVICKGHLIFTRQASAADTETRQLNLNRSRSGPLPNNNSVGSPVIECSDISKLRSVTVGHNRSSALAALIAPLPERSKELSSPTSPGGSSYSASSPTREVEITLNSWNDGNGKALQYSSSLSPPAALDYSRSSSTLELAPSVLQQSPRLISSSSNISTSSNGAHNVVDRSFEDQLQQAKAAFKKEALVRQRAEEYTIDAIRRALDAENQRDIRIEELRISREQERSLKSQIAELQKERDELQMERDHALKEAEGLKRKLGEGSNGHMLELPEFSRSKIVEATQDFNESQKIGQGGYGNIYIGRLQTEVAIKMLHSHGSQGSQEFQMEVGVLGQLRHPNLVKLIGSCPEAFALIYEYLPNGSLEDRLKCKDNSPPLSWQTRLRIAIELCSVLVYLHSSTRPHTIVHGDLKPANILLDSNFVCKLSDFGICRVLSRDQSSSDSVTLSHNTVPKGTLPYLDPEFLQRGVLTVKSDVYSFGIILLQLLTGKSPPYSIVDEVKSALRAGNFESLLDPSAGRWPFEVAQSLAELALMCSDNNRKRRPDLGTGVLELLESLRDPSGGT